MILDIAIFIVYIQLRIDSLNQAKQQSLLRAGGKYAIIRSDEAQQHGSCVNPPKITDLILVDLFRGQFIGVWNIMLYPHT